MFSSYSYEMTKALVDDRQASLRNEARQNRRARRARRGRRFSDLHNPPPSSAAIHEHLFS